HQTPPSCHPGDSPTTSPPIRVSTPAITIPPPAQTTSELETNRAGGFLHPSQPQSRGRAGQDRDAPGADIQAWSAVAIGHGPLTGDLETLSDPLAGRRETMLFAQSAQSVRPAICSA